MDDIGALRTAGALEPRANPIRTAEDWRAMRREVLADPGAFHGAAAARALHWFVPDRKAWLSRGADGIWRGWSAEDASPVALDLGAGFTPWARAFDASEAPYWRWFVGGRTNAGFNEVDRHVLAGFGEETAIIFEGDRWDHSADGGKGAPLDCFAVSRRRLLLETVKCAVSLRALGVRPGDRIALNMPSIAPQIFWIEAAKRMGVVYTAVFGGFSDKTLSDRIEDSGARVVITSDGGYRNAQVAAFKTAYTDPALDGFVSVRAVLQALDGLHLGLDGEAAAVLRATIAATLEGEATVERSDVMRGVGRALTRLGAEGRIGSADAARVRIRVASALVELPPRVEAVVVVRHTGQADMTWRADRDVWAHDLAERALAEILEAARGARIEVADEAGLLALPDGEFVRALWAASPPAPVEADYPLFIIYTSGSTGKPKGVVHAHGGYAAGISETMAAAFDAAPGDVAYVVADPGWITGQSYLISASLLTRVTTVVTEGSPVFPHAGRFASIIERHRVNIFKAGVTFLKSVMSDPGSLADVARYDLSSLRVATFCAEPTSPAVQAFGMAHVVGRYINSYWATEHGGIAWTHFFGNEDFPLRPDAHAYPLPWILGDVWVEAGEDEAGAYGGPDPAAETPFRRSGGGGAPWRRAADGEKGEVVITAPYPYLARTVWGDAETFRVVDGAVPGWRGDLERWSATYWRRWAGVWAYTQGDFAVRHGDGGFSFHGRSDDVINVSGHRLGTEEIEGAILRDKALDPNSPVGNVLVVGAPHREKGLTPLAFVTPAPGRKLTFDDKRRLLDLVRAEKGAVAVPSEILEVGAFPETRSGKYVRRMVRALVEGAPVGDASTLKNPEALVELEAAVAAWRRRQTREEEQTLFERRRYLTVQYNAVAPGRRVATVVISNPPVNALNERALDELVITAEHLARREDVVGVVFTGAGSGSFVAGADVRQMLEEIRTLDEARVLPANAQLAFARIEAMEKPCVAAVQGVALGGGLEFALACHYRVAEPDARFGQPEIRLRLLPGYGGTQRLPRLLAARRGEAGARDALDMILGGRTVDGDAALAMGLVDETASGALDPLSRAHAALREWLKDGEDSPLGRALRARRDMLAAYERPLGIDLSALLEDEHLRRIFRQLEGAGRARAGARAIEAVRVGAEAGVSAGLRREGELFAEAVVDPEGGKTGIRQFLEKESPPLPVRRDGVVDYEAVAARGRALEAAGELLPRGAPFFPAVTPLPSHQYAYGVARDPETGAPRHGPPARAERELITPLGTPGPNEALVYMLTSEVNFNDIWAITGIPVTPFDSHDEDWQTTGSGGLGLVAALGSEARAEGRLKVGDLVAVYSGQSDLLSPLAALDPMAADFSIQGYETETGSHAQFLIAQAPQLHVPPPGLTLEQAGGYILNLGTVARCLFTTLKIAPGRTAFVEGASTGTGLDALRTALRTGLKTVGLVSSEARAAAVVREGALGALNRSDPAFRELFTAVPEEPEAARAWEAAAAPLLEAFRRLNGGRLADYVVSHAGETAFPRSFQLLEAGGALAFYGASSGYHFTFMGKPGAASPEDMLRRAGALGGEGVLIFYGVDSEDLLDGHGLEILEAARRFRLRAAVATATDGQREFLQSLGFEESLAGVVSLESLRRREGDLFEWPNTLPRLPDAKADIEVFRAAVRRFQDRVMKPFGAAVGRLLRSADNPRGAPDLVYARSGHDALGVSTALVKPFTGRVVFSEDLSGRRFAFYAPQVWTRQRRILMPTAEILGTHLCNAYEVQRMNEMIAAGLIEPTEPSVVGWSDLPEAHQSMWENRHAGATYVVNHALPALGLRSRDDLFEAWSSLAEGVPDYGEGSERLGPDAG